ncbi:MAG TPA: hypothetical protein DCP25_15570 [Chloroflexi bacterium]|nr:hypothetical protein [Chloroflexota bacterium]
MNAGGSLGVQPTIAPWADPTPMCACFMTARVGAGNMFSRASRVLAVDTFEYQSYGTFALLLVHPGFRWPRNLPPVATTGLHKGSIR